MIGDNDVDAGAEQLQVPSDEDSVDTNALADEWAAMLDGEENDSE